ncbi:hypothetical protein NEIMUCOT_03810 [Neisseria mucosa ATCC 25996]|uniref:Uncharacterized protein n=1 Tax=Neisseria mucosa (strain ATCC 25996 / DSM 4631 / NCTC 10774 / M26) TaxID=546266 RepID=D2ZT74_NEIM2|nr:hypothetical protein NEIMUCOT_03810 [Neisseria mucosa ATCC 25996]
MNQLIALFTKNENEIFIFFKIRTLNKIISQTIHAIFISVRT